MIALAWEAHVLNRVSNVLHLNAALGGEASQQILVFPQFAGLGSSPMAERYAIRTAAEVRAYLRHAVLGPRLEECAEAALSIQGQTARQIFGSPDDMKLRSSATLFASVSPTGSVFHRLLDKYFQGEVDRRTLDLLAIAGEEE